MTWLDSNRYKPKHGSQIFLWDKTNQKKILLNAFWDEDSWKYDSNFPVWSYVLNGMEPIKIKLGAI